MSTNPAPQNMEQRIEILEQSVKRYKHLLDTTSENEKRYALILTATGDGLWDWNIPTGEAYFSANYYKMLGYEVNELPPSYETWSSLLHPDDRERTEKKVLEHIEMKHDSYEVEFRMKTKSGGWKWIEGRGKVVERDANKRPIRMVGVHVDIDARKRIETALAESKSQLNAVLESFNGIIYTCTRNYRIDFHNKAFRKRANRDVDGELCHKVQHGLERPCPWCVIDQVFQGKSVNVEFRSPKDERWYLSINNPIFGLLGNVERKQTVVIDITDRKEAAEKLAAKEKHLEKMNEALKSMLDHRELEKKAIEESILTNLKRLVFPYLEKINDIRLDDEAQTYVNIIKSNLEEVISPLAKTVSSKYLDLTQKEIQVADLIRQGKTSKEIADLINVSTSAVSFHRNKIREKLGLLNKKTNLHTYLTSLAD